MALLQSEEGPFRAGVGRILLHLNTMKYFFSFTKKLSAVSLLAGPLIARAQFGLEETAREAGVPGTEASLPTIIARIINVTLGFIGAILVILMLYGGFLWMTAGGSEEKITKARDIIKNSVIGLFIIVTSFAIARFVISSFTSASK